MALPIKTKSFIIPGNLNYQRKGISAQLYNEMLKDIDKTGQVYVELSETAKAHCICQQFRKYLKNDHRDDIITGYNKARNSIWLKKKV